MCRSWHKSFIDNINPGSCLCVKQALFWCQPNKSKKRNCIWLCRVCRIIKGTNIKHAYVESKNRMETIFSDICRLVCIEHTKQSERKRSSKTVPTTSNDIQNSKYENDLNSNHSVKTRMSITSKEIRNVYIDRMIPLLPRPNVKTDDFHA